MNNPRASVIPSDPCRSFLTVRKMRLPAGLYLRVKRSPLRAGGQLIQRARKNPLKAPVSVWPGPKVVKKSYRGKNMRYPNSPFYKFMKMDTKRPLEERLKELPSFKALAKWMRGNKKQKSKEQPKI